MFHKEIGDHLIHKICHIGCAARDLVVHLQVNDKIARGTAYVAYFVNEMITDFFMEHRDILKRGEDATIPVRIVKV